MLRILILFALLSSLVLLADLVLGDLLENFSAERLGKKIFPLNEPPRKFGYRYNPEFDEVGDRSNFKDETSAVFEGRRSNVPQMEVLRGNDEDSYFMNFAEVKDPGNGTDGDQGVANPFASRRAARSEGGEEEGGDADEDFNGWKPYQKRFMTNMNRISRSFNQNRERRHSNWDDKVSVDDNARINDHDISVSAAKASDVVATILQSTDLMRKSLGVCRKVVPSKFLSVAETNETNENIDLIIKDLRYYLQQSMGCRGCLQPHVELYGFLNWLIKDDVSAKCCIQKPLSANADYLLFNHKITAEGIKCNRATQKNPTKTDLFTPAPGGAPFEGGQTPAPPKPDKQGGKTNGKNEIKERPKEAIPKTEVKKERTQEDTKAKGLKKATDQLDVRRKLHRVLQPHRPRYDGRSIYVEGQPNILHVISPQLDYGLPYDELKQQISDETVI